MNAWLTGFLRLKIPLVAAAVITWLTGPPLATKVTGILLVVWLLLLPVAALLIYRVERRHPTGSAGERTLERIFSSAMIAWLRLELTMQKAALRFLLQDRHRYPVSASGRFPTAAHGRLVAVLAILIIGESVLLHLGLALTLNPPWWVHALLFYFSFYALVYLLGDLQLLRESCHRIDDAGLHLQLGLRVQAFIPWAAVRGVEPVHLSRAEARRVKDIVLVSPWQGPDLRIDLRQPVELTILTLIRRPTRAIHLSVDNPATILQAFNDRH